MIDEHIRRYLEDEEFRENDAAMQGDLAGGALDERSLSWVEPVLIEVAANASSAERCRAWIEACRATAQRRGITVSRTAIFDIEDGKLRGAIFGEPPTDGRTPPAHALLEEHIDVQRAERAPRH